MTRVLVVTTDPEDASERAGDEKPQLPATLQRWLTSGPHDIDALILDLAGPDAARAAVGNVRQRGLDVPVVLVAGEAAEWNAPDLYALPRCVVLTSPVDPKALREAVEGLSAARIAVEGGAHSLLEPPPITGGDSRVPRLEERVTEYRVTRRTRRGTGSNQRPSNTGTTSTRAPLVDDPKTPAATPPAQARDGPAPAFSPGSEAPTPAPASVEATSPVPVSAVALVRALLTRVSELDGVASTADVIVKTAIDRTGADAGVLLLPDQGRWRVAGGMGLRPIETRFELGEESWLVREIALSSRGMIIEDTDIARSRLRGAPLASWRHLVAAPVPRVGAAVLLARKSDPPFDEASLSELAKVADEAGPLLTVAMQVRSLARLLNGFRDDD